MGGVTYSQFEHLMMASGATVCSVAKDATTTEIPLYEVLVSDDFKDGRIYLPQNYNGSTVATDAMPATWAAIGSQAADPTTGTAIIILASALPAAPVDGMRVYLLRPVQVFSPPTTVTANQGTAGTNPWPITDQPATVPNAVSSGTNLSADGTLLSSAYTAASEGTILLSFAVASGSTSTVVQHTRDGGTTWTDLRRGRAWVAGSEYDIAVPVYASDVWNARVVSATTVGVLRVLFVPSI